MFGAKLAGVGSGNTAKRLPEIIDRPKEDKDKSEEVKTGEPEIVEERTVSPTTARAAAEGGIRNFSDLANDPGIIDQLMPHRRRK
jgi:hypothetical protein